MLIPQDVEFSDLLIINKLIQTSTASWLDLSLFHCSWAWCLRQKFASLHSHFHLYFWTLLLLDLSIFHSIPSFKRNRLTQVTFASFPHPLQNKSKLLTGHLMPSSCCLTSNSPLLFFILLSRIGELICSFPNTAQRFLFW